MNQANEQQEQEPIVIPEPPTPASKSAQIKEMISKASGAAKEPAEAAEQEAAEPAAKEQEEKPNKSREAVREARELRKAREEKQALERQLSELKGKAETADRFSKAQELFNAGNAKEAIRLLGGDPHKAYQALTDNFLAQDADLDPVQEKLKQIDPYLETLKKKAADFDRMQAEIKTKEYVSSEVAPIVSQQEQFECLYEMFSEDNKGKKLSQSEVQKLVADTVYFNAERYFSTELGNNMKRLEKEFGNINAFYLMIAEHLENQLAGELEKSLARASKLSRFKDKLAATDAPQEKEIAATAPKSEVAGIIETLSQPRQPSPQAQAPKASKPINPDRRSQLNSFFKKHGIQP